MERDQDHLPNLLDDSDPSQISERSEQRDEIDLSMELMQQQRRQQVLKEINQDNDPRQEHEQLNQILEKRQRREEKKAKKTQEEELKNLRQKNALQFFRKIKTIVLLNFKDSMIQAYQAQAYLQEERFRIFSCLKVQTLTFYQDLYQKQPKYITRVVFIDFIQSIFTASKIEFQDSRKKYCLIWALAIILGIGFRVLRFIDLSNLQLQAFYNLKYEKKKQKLKKGKKKPSKKLSKNASKKSFASQQIDFDEMSQEILASSLSLIDFQSLKYETQRLHLKTFRESFCEIYCPVQNDWALFNMQTLQIINIEQFKEKVLNKKAVMGFYSVRVIHFAQDFKFLAKQRVYGNVQFRDHTIDFCDKLQNVLKRRHRLGCKTLYRDIIRQSNIFKTLTIFTNFDKQLIALSKNKQQKWALQNFPKNSREMRMSQYFVVPSLVDKYMILKQDAKPIPELQFRQEKVYSKKDLLKVSSRMGWIDQYRMVKQGELPVKTTETMRKTTTKLFLFTQTEPFKFKFNQDGDFVLDQQYNSIYVPPTFTPPKGYILLPYNVDYICKRNKLKSARIVQGFDVAGWHIIPNNIGFLIEQQHKEQIEKLYYERQQKLKQKRQSKKQKQAIGLWKKLFKSIVITQQV